MVPLKNNITKKTVCETIDKHQHYVNLVCISFVYRMFIVKLGFLETDWPLQKNSMFYPVIEWSFSQDRKLFAISKVIYTAR